MASTNKNSQGTEENENKDFFKGEFYTESENLCCNLPENKPGCGAKTFCYVENGCLSKVFNQSQSLEKEPSILNSNSKVAKKEVSEKVKARSSSDLINSSVHNETKDIDKRRLSSQPNQANSTSFSFPTSSISPHSPENIRMGDVFSIPRSELLDGKDINISCGKQKIDGRQDKVLDVIKSTNFDELRLNYTDRPVLPLKRNQRQKSLSCTNLVEAVKGFSIRKPSDNIRSLFLGTLRSNFKQENNDEATGGNVLRHYEEKVSQAGHQLRNEGMPVTQSPWWYHPVDAKEASRRLLEMEHDGAFLIRPASKPTREIFYTLCVSCNNVVYNMHIRYLENGNFALGKKKQQEKTFSSLKELIQFYQEVPLPIYMQHFNKTEYVYLLISPGK